MLVQRVRGAEGAAPVVFSSVDELRAILPGSPPSAESLNAACLKIIDEWETYVNQQPYEEPLHMRSEVEGDPLFAPEGAETAGYRIRDITGLTPEEPRDFSWHSWTIFPTYQHGIVGQHRAGLSPGFAPSGARYDVVPVDVYGRLIVQPSDPDA